MIPRLEFRVSRDKPVQKSTLCSTTSTTADVGRVTGYELIKHSNRKIIYTEHRVYVSESIDKETMGVLYKFVILTSLAIVNAVSIVDDNPCCRQNNVFVRSQTHCQDIANNRTSRVLLSCSKTRIIIGSDRMPLTVNGAGQLVLNLPNRQVEFEPEKFCIGGQTKSIDRGTKTVAVVCYEEETKTIEGDVYGYCMVISAIFLLVTAFEYAITAEYRDLQGISIIQYCLCLALGMGILAAMKLVPYSDMNLCAARGFLSYFFVITSFFWSNAISMQNLLSIRQQDAQPEGQYSKKHLICYSVYAWGVPVVLTIAMAVVNFMPGNHLKPGIGLNHCWFFNVKQQWHYMYSVMSVLILINISIFICISILTWYHSSSLKYKVITTIRLFVVMGVPWVFEMIGTLVPHHLAWEIVDVFNSLQGVFIFIVLVCLRRVGKVGINYQANITMAPPYKKMAL